MILARRGLFDANLKFFASANENLNLKMIGI